MTRAAQIIGLIALTAVLGLLLRNGLAAAAHVPLDPNEGWMAAHVLRLLAGGPLYPPPSSLLVNNYPPLSFYAIAALTPLTGDAVIAGRLLAFAAFLAVCGLLLMVGQRMGARAAAAGLGVLFFALTLLTASDYVGIADPQMLGHAIQLGALLILLRGHIAAAALLLAASLFVKHNLVALPLACTLWLTWRHRRAGTRFIGLGLIALGAGMIAFQLCYGISLWQALMTPRLSSLANLSAAVTHLWWAPIPLAAAALLKGPYRGFLLTYMALALLLGLFFATGDGVDANAFFDLAIAAGLTLTLSAPLFAIALAPPLLFLALNWDDNHFVFGGDFAAQTAGDIAFVRAHPGPALCAQLSLCQWAGAPAQVDVFNIGEAIKTGARDPAPLVHAILARRLAVIQLDDMDALGPAVKAAIAKAYRLDHESDNGRFFLPEKLKPAP